MAKKSLFVLQSQKSSCSTVVDTCQSWILLVAGAGLAIHHQGRTQRGFEGVHQIQLGVWGGAVSPPAGSGAEPRKISKLTLFRG